MAALSNPVNTTAVTEIINSEAIGGVIEQANRTIPVWAQLARACDTTGDKSNSRTFPIWERNAVPLSESSGKTQTDEYAYTAQSLAEVVIAHAKVGTASNVSDEALQDAEGMLLAEIVEQQFLEMLQQEDEDFLSNITSASNANDESAADLSIAIFNATVGQLRALNPNAGRFAFVGQPIQIQDLSAAILAASGSIFGGALGDRLSDGVVALRRGYVGVYQGVEVYENSNVPQFDASNWSGAMMVAGNPHGAIAMCMKAPTVPADAMGQATGRLLPLNHLTSMEWLPLRDAYALVTRARYGTGIVNQSQIVELITSKT